MLYPRTQHTIMEQNVVLSYTGSSWEQIDCSWYYLHETKQIKETKVPLTNHGGDLDAILKHRHGIWKENGVHNFHTGAWVNRMQRQSWNKEPKVRERDNLRFLNFCKF